MFALAERTAPDLTANLPSVSWRLASALVTDAAPSGAITIDLDGHAQTVRRAASCLLEPACGDRVLIALTATDAYVLAVLERGSSVAATVSVGAAAPLVIRGREVAIAAAREISLDAPSIIARAHRFTLLADAMGFVGKVLTQAIDRWRVSANATEIVSRDFATKVARRVTIVEETDTLEAGAVVQNIATATVTSANAAVIAAKEDLRLDGERVTVG